MSDNTPPPRLLDPGAPTPPKLRALLTALRPRDPSDEAEQRIEARVFETLSEERATPAPTIPRRSAG